MKEAPECICCHIAMKAELFPVLMRRDGRKIQRVIRYGCKICDYKTSIFTGFGFTAFNNSVQVLEGIYRQEESARGQPPMTFHRKYSNRHANMIVNAK